jgi:hypothetical protein
VLGGGFADLVASRPAYPAGVWCTGERTRTLGDEAAVGGRAPHPEA